MGRTRRKKKTTQKPDVEEGKKKSPKAFVIERGRVGHILSQLVLDLRQIMEPHTASRLKVRRKNVLKDFVAVAGPLGVTHFLLVSRTTEFVNLKVCVLPRGPTVTFHVKAFCLAREVLSSLKAPAVNPAQFLTPPMLALNNFSAEDKVSHLLSTVFQNLFPAISVHSVNLADIRRCLMLDFAADSQQIELRHYASRIVPQGTSRGVKKLSRTHLPNLGKLSDISEYLLSGYASESDGEEALGGEGDVILPQDLPGRANLKSEQSAVRLSEIGPRLTLQLVKIEAGLCEGEVLHHMYVQKSKQEQRALKRVKEGERRLKEGRKRLQEANIARKQQEKEQHKARCLAGMVGEEAASSDGGEEGDGVEEEEEVEDSEWFRREVGQEPDPDLFGSGSGAKRSLKERGRKRALGSRDRGHKHVLGKRVLGKRVLGNSKLGGRKRAASEEEGYNAKKSKHSNPARKGTKKPFPFSRKPEAGTRKKQTIKFNKRR